MMLLLNLEKTFPIRSSMFKVSIKRKAGWTVSLLVLVTALLAAAPAFAQSTGGLKGKVRTPKGDGISGASVTARQKGTDVKTVRSDSKGNFAMDGLESGTYNLVFEAPGFSSGVLYNVEVKKRKVSDLPDRLMLSVDQGTQVIIRGSVFYKEGTSLTGAKVELERVNADGTTKRIATANTTATGEFTFRQPEGSAKFRVTASFKGVKGSKEVEVDSAAIYRLAISLDISRTEK